jgi:hypothetical protein
VSGRYDANDPASPLQLLLGDVGPMLKAAARQLADKSPKTRMGMFTVLRTLVGVLPGSVADHVGMLVPGACALCSMCSACLVVWLPAGCLQDSVWGGRCACELVGVLPGSVAGDVDVGPMWEVPQAIGACSATSCGKGCVCVGGGGMFMVLRTLVGVLPGSVADHVGMLVPGACAACSMCSAFLWLQAACSVAGDVADGAIWVLGSAAGRWCLLRHVL